MPIALPSETSSSPLHSHPVREFLSSTFRKVGEKTLAIDGLRRLYRTVAGTEGVAEFLDASLRVLDLSWSVPEADREKIPARGPLIVVANHPYGAAEGMVLARLLLFARPDVKVLANCLLSHVKELRELFLFVDPFGRADAASRNVGALREAVRWVRGGGALAVFPAGEVAHLDLRRGGVADPPWSPSVGRLVRLTGAPVQPVHFGGRNRTLFQMAGLVHPRLRTALLPRELLALARRRIELRVGSPVPFGDLDALARDEDLVACLRLRTELLGARAHPTGARRPLARGRRLAALGAPVAPERLRAEVETLPGERRLAGHGELEVLWARAQEIPSVLAEIGRLREGAFRAVGEGSGRDRDLDRFDQTYLHLFLWNGEAKEVAGAYRLGQSDLLAARKGVRGLYTSTLFRYGPRFLESLGPALELGRSFVRAEYQRGYAPLLLLWRGIGRFVAGRPRYRVLFGPVSISRDYLGASRELMVRQLAAHLYAPELARRVRPRRPLRPRERALADLARRGLLPRGLEDLSRWVSDLEPDGKGLPVLLRHYLKLGAQVIGFNVDPRFQETLDCLVAVDLTRSPRALLDRHLGPEGAQSFLAFHAAAETPAVRCA
ncbi:MAG: lysophospholipid acyltransferase family protein [Deferrisomatales bacterium]